MATKAEEIDVDGVAVRLTNRDKPYFPKLGSKGTKGALFDYYLSVADRMVNLLRERSPEYELYRHSRSLAGA